MFHGEAESVLDDDVWYEIQSRLPTKSLVNSKCVCKNWHDSCCYILVRHRKMPFISTHGVFLLVNHLYSPGKIGSYIIYAPLSTKDVLWRIDSSNENIINYGYNEQLLGNLSLDLNPLYDEPAFMAAGKIYFNAHNGLILTVNIDNIYKVVNPATKQVLKLPNPPYNKEFIAMFGEKWISFHVIINLSYPGSSSVCSFVVLRFPKPNKVVDIYSSVTRKWVQCELPLKNSFQFIAGWFLDSHVYLRESQTLYFLTNRGRCVALQLGSLDHKPIICALYLVSLPKVVRRKYDFTRLGECKGCIYLSHVDMEDRGGIWIWKHCGVSSANDPWILLLEISRTARLCKPVVEKHLGKFYDDGCVIIPMGIHLEMEIVCFFVMPGMLFSYDLTNDIWVQIALLDRTEGLKLKFVHSYTPCFASLGTSMA